MVDPDLIADIDSQIRLWSRRGVAWGEVWRALDAVAQPIRPNQQGGWGGVRLRMIAIAEQWQRERRP